MTEAPNRLLATKKRTPGPEPDPRANEAYLAWATTADKGRGCLVKLARDLELDLDKVRYWKSHYHWEARWIDDIHGAKVAMLREGEAVLLANLRPAMDRLGKIAVTGSDRDAVNAIKVFASILGIEQSKGDRHLHVYGVDPELIATAKEASSGEMKRVLQEIGQSNIEAARAVKRRPS